MKKIICSSAEYISPQIAVLFTATTTAVCISNGVQTQQVTELGEVEWDD